MDYRVFNTKKAEGWQTKTKEDFEKWLTEFREWFQCQIFRNGEEKEQFAQQIKDLKEKKEAYFSKQGQRPLVNHYIFQPDLAAALTEYLKVLTEIKRKELQG